MYIDNINGIIDIKFESEPLKIKKIIDVIATAQLDLEQSLEALNSYVENLEDDDNNYETLNEIIKTTLDESSVIYDQVNELYKETKQIYENYTPKEF